MQLRSDKDKYKILLCIILANHFFYKIKNTHTRHVFEEYFAMYFTHIFNKREQLKKLFKGQLESMCEHYFIEREDEDGNIIGFIDPDSLDPDDLFDKLFDNVVLKPESGFAIFKIPKNKKRKKSERRIKKKPVKSAKKKGGKSKKSKKSKKLNKTKKSKK